MWVERYRPATIEETILPEATKKILKKYVADGEITGNLLLSGLSGSGKTTAARAMIEEIGGDYLFINASLDRNIDTLRNTIIEFASKVSMFGGKRKYVILDEADNLNPTSMQPALKAAMEELSGNCTFILTANHRNKIITPLQGRCALIEFNQPKGDEKKSMLTQVFHRYAEILDQEAVTYDRKVLMQHIARYFPDMRKALNELQHYSKSGSIDVGILSSTASGSISELFGFIRDKKFTDMRKWVAEHPDVDFNEFANSFQKIFDDLAPQCLPGVIVELRDADFQNAFVVNKEIHLVATITKIMGEIQWK